MFKFQEDLYLLLLLLLVPIALLVLYYLLSKKKSLSQFADNKFVERLSPYFSIKKSILKYSLLSVALALLIICIANPQRGSKVEKIERKGVDLMLCLDISNSMNAEDIQPSRLMRAKQAIVKLLEKLKSDRIGLVVFAGRAYTQLPLTNDYGAAKMFIELVSTNDISLQGTAIGSAIEMASQAFENDPDKKKNKAIIVISDGENFEDNAVEMAKKAVDNGIIVSTIGMGLPEGAPIPNIVNGRHSGYKYDRQGQVVITKLNEEMLREIALAGDGIYTGANNITTGIEKIFDNIGKLDKKTYDSKNYSDFETKFQYILWIVIALLVADIFIFEKKNKFFMKIKIFE